MVDDSERWRIFLRALLERTPEFQIIGEASDGIEAINMAVTFLPDVILLDIGMPRLNGIAAAAVIRQACPESKIIFLTQEYDCEVRNAALATGAVAYVLKSHAREELRGTIQTAMLDSRQAEAQSFTLVSFENQPI